MGGVLDIDIFLLVIVGSSLFLVRWLDGGSAKYGKIGESREVGVIC